MMKFVNKDVRQLLYAYVPSAQEMEKNMSTIKTEIQDTEINQMELLGIFLLSNVKQREKNVKKDVQSFSEL